jgi:calcineurin-like phosphoesterase family protein
MTTFYTADHHFFHKNIIEYCNRPFKSEKEMRDRLIQWHNETVKKDDTVFFLNDLAMVGPSQWEKVKGVLNKMNGRKHLILGNHDEIKPFRYVDCGFITVHTALWQEVEGFHIVMAHDPSVYCAIAPESILLCGHIHTLFKSIPEQRVVNVGVDMWNFRPITFQQIREELKI